MTKQERKEKIQELENQKRALIEESLLENQKEILPFIKQHAICHYSSFNIKVELPDNQKNELVDLINNASAGTYDAATVSITDMLRITTIGDSIIIYTKSPESAQHQETIFNTFAKLGLSISFDNAITDAERKKKLAQDKINELKKLEETYKAAV